MIIDVNSDPILKAARLHTPSRSPQHARHCNNSNCCHLGVMRGSTVVDTKSTDAVSDANSLYFVRPRLFGKLNKIP